MDAKERFQTIRDNCVSIIGLKHWYFEPNVSNDYPFDYGDEKADACVVSRITKYFRGTIWFKQSIVEDIENDELSIAKLVLHELCHFYCGSGQEIFSEYFENKVMISGNDFIYIHNMMNQAEEQMVVTLENIFVDIYENKFLKKEDE